MKKTLKSENLCQSLPGWLADVIHTGYYSRKAYVGNVAFNSKSVAGPQFIISLNI